MTSNSKLQQRENYTLSEFPDEILIHILSYSGTTCAVRTRILSKRWRTIWASVPNLDFDSKSWNDELSFKRFVNGVLSLRNLFEINKFRLHCYVEDFSDINRWINTALGGNVVEVDLSIISNRGQIFEIPSIVFTSHTLEALTLRSNFIIKPPICRFPSLKFLYVHIFHPDMVSMMNLLLDFPVLEELVIDGTTGQEVWGLDINALRLKKITIRLCTVPEPESDNEGGEEDGVDEGDEEHGVDDGGEDEGSEEDSSEEDGSEHLEHGFYIKSPRLEILNLSMDVLSCFKLRYEHCLVKANIDLYDHTASEHPKFAIRASGLLKSVSEVKYLSLSAHYLKVSCLPSFNKLKELKLVSQGCHRLESLILEILERSPNLECFVLDHEIDNCGYNTKGCLDNSLKTLQAVPLCLMSKLKTISIMRFMGLPEEMEVMKYLLKTSRVLKSMTISMSRTNCGDAKELQRNLLMFPRGSKDCEVKLM